MTDFMKSDKIISKKSFLLSLARSFVRFYLPGWKVRFTQDVESFGQCLGDEELIELSLPLAEVGTITDFLETVLHEIAHGLTWQEEKAHGPKWKKMCRLLGCPTTATSGKRGGELKRLVGKAEDISCKNK
jgi:predicted SprT family Zn-dependent metalloprotease